MSRHRLVAAVLGCALLVAGGLLVVHGHAAGPSAPRATRTQDDPPWVPVNGTVGTGPVPSALPARPDLIQIDAVAHHAHTRTGGEQFALLVAQLITDTRAADPGPGALSRVESARMPRSVRDYLLHDAKDQRQIRSERHYDTGLDIWIRSEAVGPSPDPRRVDVEVAANLVSRPLQVQDWYRDRFDVAWESGGWRLINYSAGLFGPSSTQNLTPAEQRSFLTGVGWRRIPAR
ncbi:MAG: hypothetical protein JWP74_2319 [Marmoricola sp.]|nr:hypothetical protein [Marmoricola sp.]